jgi:IS605 OrfB family transposase
MATKAITAKVVCRSDEKYTAEQKKEFLRLTHRLFNESLPFVIHKMFQMKRGELGPKFQKIFEQIKNSQSASQKIEAVTVPNWTGARKKGARGKFVGTNDEKNLWADYAFELTHAGNLLFDRNKELPGFSSEFRRKIFEMAFQRMSGFQEIHAKWKSEYKEWLQDKEKWEKDNADYMAERPRFIKFEEEFGKLRGKRAHRGHRIKEFYAANPDLERFDGQHRIYWRYYERFRRRPTFTVPSVKKHPEWLVFKKSASYGALDIKQGSVRLKVVTSDTPDGRNGQYVLYAFNPDKRLITGNFSQVKGVKLIYKRGIAYFVFTCVYDDLPSRIGLKQASVDKYSPQWVRKKILAETGPLTTVAIDLGTRHLAAATVRKNGNIVATRFLRLGSPAGNGDGAILPGPSLPHIADQKWLLRRERWKRGKPIKGENSCVSLQTHTTNMGADRFKKAAHTIVKFAKEHNADLIIFEKLKGLIPNTEARRGLNRNLMNWNRRGIVEFAKTIGVPKGLRVIEVSPGYSSQICNKCGSPGARFNLDANRQFIHDNCGKLFHCFKCGYQANADFNASVNLHKIFYGEFPYPAKNTGKGMVVTADGVRFVVADEVARIAASYGAKPRPDA